MKSTVLCQVRSGLEVNYPEGADEHPLIDVRGAQSAAFGLTPLTQIVQHGHSYQVTATTSVAPVTAIPTTAYLLGLWNGEPDHGKCYIIDSVFLVRTATSAAFQEASILCNVSFVPIATALANTLIPRCMSGNRIGYGGNARVAVSGTITAANGGSATNWFPAGSTNPAISAGAANLGGQIEVDCRGRYIIPPKGQFSLTAITSVATAASVRLGVRWHEAILPVVV